MKKYLIDTNIAIFYMKGMYHLDAKFDAVEEENCFISEITLAELKYGIENSDNPEKLRAAVADFLTGVQILPIFSSLDLYASEKAKLRRTGAMIDDFDLLIAVTSVTHNLVMVTNNIKHFERVQGIDIEDWTRT